MGISVAKDFKKYTCLNAAGETEDIPAGRHIVTEDVRGVVTVQIGTKIIELDKDTYEALKAKRIVTEPVLF